MGESPSWARTASWWRPGDDTPSCSSSKPRLTDSLEPIAQTLLIFRPPAAVCDERPASGPAASVFPLACCTPVLNRLGLAAAALDGPQLLGLIPSLQRLRAVSHLSIGQTEIEIGEILNAPAS